MGERGSQQEDSNQANSQCFSEQSAEAASEAEDRTAGWARGPSEGVLRRSWTQGSKVREAWGRKTVGFGSRATWQ